MEQIEFKTLEEIKEEYAKSHAFDNWSSMYSYLGVLQKQDACDEVAKRYAQQYINANKELVEMLKTYLNDLNNIFPRTDACISRMADVQELIAKHKQL